MYLFWTHFSFRLSPGMEMVLVILTDELWRHLVLLLFLDQQHSIGSIMTS